MYKMFGFFLDSAYSKHIRVTNSSQDSSVQNLSRDKPFKMSGSSSSKVRATVSTRHRMPLGSTSPLFRNEGISHKEITSSVFDANPTLMKTVQEGKLFLKLFMIFNAFKVISTK